MLREMNEVKSHQTRTSGLETSNYLRYRELSWADGLNAVDFCFCGHPHQGIKKIATENQVRLGFKRNANIVP